MVAIYEKFTQYEDAAVAWFEKHILAIRLFFLVAGSIAGAAFVLAVGATAVFVALDDGRRPPEHAHFEIAPEFYYDEEYIALPEQYEDEETIAARTNFMLVGLDNFQLADAIMVGAFYRDTGQINLMSIPRDMIVRIPPHRLERMRADGIHPPRTLKVNAMRSHGGQVHGIYYLMEQLEEMFGISFDFYVEVELAAFRRVVDAIGGVYMDIPRRLWYICTNPPGLRIDVPAGENVRLDGVMAEGVVRYRQWPMGDLQRNQMQMEFMSQLIRQASTRDALLHDPRELIRTINENVRSNLGFLDALMFIPYIPRVDIESVETFTMPGTLGRVDGVGYFIPSTEELPGVIADIFHAVLIEGEDEDEDEDEEDEDEDEEPSEDDELTDDEE